jgi:hypothetical protein
MKNHNLVPDLNTMNELIRLIAYISSSSVYNKKDDSTNKTEPLVEKKSELTIDKKIEIIMEKLNEIKKYELTPNLLTFNNTLFVIKSFGLNQKSIPLALNILKEMELLNIEPSLATWTFVLQIFYPIRDIGTKTNVLDQIITRVEQQLIKNNQELQWKDVNDSLFFKVAMEKCLISRDHFKHAKRIHDIVMKDNNIKFLNDQRSHRIYL